MSDDMSTLHGLDWLYQHHLEASKRDEHPDGADFNWHAAMILRDAHKILSGVVWMPRSQRLPKEAGEYLVYHPNGGALGEYRVVRFGTSKGFENGRDKARHPDKRITHWMPLPEPPEDELPEPK